MAEVVGNCEDCYYAVDEGGNPLCPAPNSEGVNACAIASARFADFMREITANPDGELATDVTNHRAANCPHSNCTH